MNSICNAFCLLFSLLLLGGPALAQTQEIKDEHGQRWLEIAEHRLWLPIAKDWSWQRQDRGQLLTLELRAPRGVAGITLWGGDLGRQMHWQQLAQVWRERSSALGNMVELVDTPVRSLATGLEAVQIHYQTWFGRVAGQPTLTRVGYLVDGERAFVLMGIWLVGDNEAARQINSQLEGLRLVQPAALPAANRPTADTASTESITTSEEAELPARLLPRALPPPQTETTPASVQTQAPTSSLLPDPKTHKSPPTNQLPMPVPAPEVPQSTSSNEPQLRAPLPARPMIRALRLVQAGQGQSISRWQQQLDFRAQALNLPKDAALEALWLLNGDGPFARQWIHQQNDQLAFQLKAADGLFPTGDYRLQLRLDDLLLAELDYQLRDPSESELIRLAEEGNAKARLGLYAYLEMGRLERLTKAEALEWLRQSAEQNLPMAQYLYGLVLLEGRHGVKKDPARAMDWFRAAALQNQATAAHALAMGYRTGQGLAKDQNEAFTWSQKAAELDYKPAFFFVGMHYLLGRGVKKDEAKARDWLTKAAEQGDKEARAVLRHLDAKPRAVTAPAPQKQTP